MFHPLWRRVALAQLAEPFDVIVVGAGITGSGVALDAAQRGLRTLLIERGDVASGTSSRSSKLVHGGLRYLKQMQFRITRLACRERDRMMRLNPHLVTPIRFVYPAYRGDRTPGWKVDLGLWMYDQLTGHPDKHSQLSSEELSELAPDLRTDDLDRALSYTDAMTDDARLTLAVAATAHACGAVVLPRCELLEGVRSPAGRVVGLRVRDLESGDDHCVETDIVVNATGVWTDAVRDRLGLTGRRLRPSRGVHLVLPRSSLPIAAAVTVPSPDDGRPVFLIPHPEGILLGTTDIYHDGSLDDPRPTNDEVDYLLRAVAGAFGDRAPSRAEVRGAFGGLRPILDSHADDPSEASREEDLWHEEGVLSVAGGKLTTWRSTAEDTVDEVLGLLPEESAKRAAPCATKGTPLANLAPADLSHRLGETLGLDPTIATAMARRLGALSWEATRLARHGGELKPLVDGSDICAAEVRGHLRWGAVLRLEDLMLRRLRIGMWHPEAAVAMLRRVRPLVRRAMGWKHRRWTQEEDAFRSALEQWTLEGIGPPQREPEPGRTPC